MSTKKIWKRGLSLLLAVLMVASMLPSTLFMESSAAVPSKKIYFDPGCWNTAGAKFHAWVWGGSVPGDGAWYEATGSGSSYSISIPADATGMKWLRKDPNNASYGWDCWNQTGDLSIGTNNKCTITDWGSANMSLVKDTYSVSYSGTGITSGTGTATAGADYSVTLSAKTGYNLPSSVTVTVGGTALTNSTHYTYSGGKVTVKAQYVTGTINITGTGTPKTYTVTYSGSNYTKPTNTSCTHGTEYSATLKASSGYTLPSSITVKAGSTTLTSGTGYTYNASTGALTVKAAYVTGNLTITVSPIQAGYTVTFNGTNVTSSGSGGATHGVAYKATLTASAGYKLPSSITVKVGSTNLTSGVGYTYNSSTGALTVNASYVTGNITITATAGHASYNVTTSLDGVSKSSGGTTATHGTNYTAKITANTGYSLPGSITITVGGSTLATSKYTYSSSTGSITIPGDNIIGDIIITATGTKKSYSVTYKLTGCTKSSGASTVSHGTEFGATIKANTNHYALSKSSFTVTVNGSAMNSNYWSYDASSGLLYINTSGTVGNIVITAETYQQYFVAGNAELCGSAWDENDPDNVMTRNSDGTYTLTFAEVPAGNHALKVTDGTWSNSWGGLGADGNYEISLDVKSKVVVNFNPSTYKVTVEVEALVSKYTVTFNTTNLTASGAASVYQGNAYTATLTPSTYYKLPGSITVKVGNTTLSASKYTYDSTTGAISIPGSSVTGNITITAAGEALQYYVVGSENITGADWTVIDANLMTKTGTNTYSLTYKKVPGAADGTYLIKIVDSAGGWHPEGVGNDYWVNVPNLSDVTIQYNAATGAITHTVTPCSVSVTLNSGTGVTITGNSSATAGTNYTATVKASNGYSLPDSVTVTINGATVTSGYSYNSSTGVVTITGSAITGNITITAAADKNTYTVTYNGSNYTKPTNTLATHGAAYTATLTAATGYDLPSTITVTVGGKTITGYTYTAATGALNIPASLVTGNIVVTVNPVKESYNVSFSGSNYTHNGAASVSYNTAYSVTLTPATGYDLPGSITVTVGGKTITGYTYNAGNGTLTIPASQVTGSITISVTPVKKSLTVTYNGSGYIAPSNKTATYGETYTATLTAQSYYSLPESVTVTIGGTASNGFTYNAATGVLTINASAVKGNIVVNATGYKQYFVAGNAELCGSEWSSNDSNNLMTRNSDGTYSLVYTDAPAGDHELKVTNGTWDQSWGKNGQNYPVNLPVESRVEVTFDPDTGVVDVKITPLVNLYNVIFNCTNITAEGEATVYHGRSYTAILTPAKGYKLPDSITVRVAGNTISAGLYSYDSTTGQVDIGVGAVAGDITIIAAGEKIQYYLRGETGLTGSDWDLLDTNLMTDSGNGIYTIIRRAVAPGKYEMKIYDTAGNWHNGSGGENNYVADIPNLSDVTITFNSNDGTISISCAPCGVAVELKGTNVTISGDSSAVAGTAYTATLTADQFYKLPDSVTVTIDGNAYTGFTYADGKVTIPGNAITGKIVITAVGEKLQYYVMGDAGITGEAWTQNDANKLTEGNNHIYTISYFNIPAGTYEIKVQDTAGKWYPTGDNYVIDMKALGNVTVSFNAATGEITVTQNAQVVNVTFNGTNVSSDGSKTATAGMDYVANLTVPAGYALPRSITVFVGGKSISGYTYANGKLTVPGNLITGDVEIIAVGVAAYSVVLKGTNATINGANFATGDEDYVAGVTVGAGYKLPSAVTVQVNGVALSTDAYSYDSTTGTITIPAARITGNITITAAGESLQYYIVGTDKLCGVDWILDEANKLTDLGNGIYTITYEQVSAGDYEIKVQDTAGKWYSGSNSENNFVIETEFLSNIVITFDANNNKITYTTTPGTVSVKHSGENVTMTGASSVTAGQPYSATLTAASGYVLPNSVLVMVNGVRIESGYTYDRTTGKITIDGSAVTGNVEIVANGVGVYSASYSGTHASVTGSATVYGDTDLVVTVTPASGYIMPAVVVVKVGNTTLTEGQYIYDRATGKVTIPAQYPTGNVQVSATGDTIAYYIVGDSGFTGVDWQESESNRLAPNGDGTYSITYNSMKPHADGYYEIKVKSNAGTWYSGSNNANNTSNYWLQFDYLANITITFTPNNTQGIITYEVNPVEYDVTFTGNDITFNGGKANSKDDYSATLVPASGCILPEHISVTVDGVELTSGYTYNRYTGAVTIQKAKLTGNVEIKADAIETSYIVAGTSGLCGSDWDLGDKNNEMHLNTDGTYSIVYNYVEAGNYQFKVSMNGEWLWPAENYVLNLSSMSRVTIHYDPANANGWVDIVAVSPPERYDRIDEITLPGDSVFYADMDLVDFLNNNRVLADAAEGYYTDNQGEWIGSQDAVYSRLNYLIGQQVANAGYTYPLYFGLLNFIESRYGLTGSSGKWNNLPNWSSAANVALGYAGNGDINASAVVQGLVGNGMDANGNLIDPVTDTPLLYFNKTAALEWTNDGHRVMAYYDNLKFPFKKNYNEDTRVTTYSYDSALDYAVYYDYENNQLYASNTFVKDQKDNKGFYPLNEPDDKDNEVNNGFGAKFSIDFTVGDKGVLASGEPVTFEFTGDDDVWVFIDGVLVLDMGGAHAKANGKIDFSNLTATVSNAAQVTDSYVISGKDSYKFDTYSNQGLANWLYGNTEERATVSSTSVSKTFANLGLDFDYDQVHTMTVFYMERGMVESNFSMEFTMVPVPSGLTLSKDLNDEDINAGLLNAISNAEDFNFFLSATSPSDTSVAFSNYTITDKFTGKTTLKLADGSTSGSTYSANISGITNYAYAHSFFTTGNEDAFIPGTTFSIEETTNSIFKYDATSWAVYDASNGYSLVTNSTENSQTAAFTMGDAKSTKAYSYAVSFTNTMQLGSLSVTKIFDDPVLANNEFRFYVYLDLDGQGDKFKESLYSDLVYTSNGKSYTSTDDGTISVIGGQTAVINGIPAGATYRIVEIVPEDAPWYQSAAVNTTGTISKNTTVGATITNVTKTTSADKAIFVEAGKATDYTIVLNGKTITVSQITPETGLTVVKDGTKLIVTGNDSNKAYTADYEGRYPDGTIVSGKLTVYTFAATHKTYVFDFGLNSNLAATTDKNDGLFQGGHFYNDNVEGTTAMLGTVTGDDNYQTTITASESAWIFDDGSSSQVLFSPVAFMSRVESYSYTVQIVAPNASFDPNNPETGCVVKGSIQVMPANSVYYEDNFNITGDDATKKIIFGGGAEGQSSAPDMKQSNQQFTNYGYDSCYNLGYQYSGGAAVTLDSMQYAYFTFTGDGFDLYSRTAADSAGLAVYVFAGGHDPAYIDYLTNPSSTKAPAEMVFVNNYYNNGNLYQVPVIKVDMNKAVKEKDKDGNAISYWGHGEYTVYIQCLPTTAAKTAQLDGVRIYNPMTETSQYPLVTERKTKVDELRVLFRNKYLSLAGNSPMYGIFVGTGKHSIIESMVGNKYTTAEDLENIYVHGPNNEIYLPENFGIRMHYTVNAKDTFTLQVGMKALGSAKTVGIYARVTGTGSYYRVGSVNIASTTDMYYDLTALLAKYSQQGITYDLVLISESPDNTNQFVSLTTVKYSGMTIPEIEG